MGQADFLDEKWVKKQLDLFFRDGNRKQLDTIINHPQLRAALRAKRFMKQGQPTMQPIEYCAAAGLLCAQTFDKLMDVFDQECRWMIALDHALHAREGHVFALLWERAQHQKLDTEEIFLRAVRCKFITGIDCLTAHQSKQAVMSACRWAVDETGYGNVIGYMFERRPDWMDILNTLRTEPASPHHAKFWERLATQWAPEYLARMSKNLLLDQIDPQTSERQRPKRSM